MDFTIFVFVSLSYPNRFTSPLDWTFTGVAYFIGALFSQTFWPVDSTRSSEFY